MTSKEPTDGELLHELLVRNHIPPLCPPHDGHLDQAAAEFSRPYRERIAELEKRLAESAAAPTVDGKTPGQVFAQISSQVPLSLPLEKAREIIATSLLRTFGQSSQTTQDAAEALRMVRDKLCSQPAFNFVFGMEYVTITQLRKVFDDELARLEAKPAPTSDHVHEIGSCSYCDKGSTNRDERKP